MRKILLISVLSLLPFTQMAALVLHKAGAAFKMAGAARPAPELPLNSLQYFLQ